MTNKDTVLAIFNQWYIDMINDEVLIRDLKNFESNFKDTDIWFRFFKDDTLATDIRNIEYGLSNTRKNRAFMIENIKTALLDPENFQLNFDTYKREES